MTKIILSSCAWSFQYCYNCKAVALILINSMSRREILTLTGIFFLYQAQDLNVIEEVIRMMLEIINSCLTNSLHHNPNLVYALLYKRDLFEQFRTHPSFQDIMQNIDLVSVNVSLTKLKKKTYNSLLNVNCICHLF